MLDLIKELINIVLHIDVYLTDWVNTYNALTYLILFAIIFCETGLVVTPFLPGDSLIFAAGAIAALPTNPLNIYFLAIILLSAAILGDNTNFFIGRFIGQKVYDKNYRLIKRKYLDKTHEFYEKHGGKTLIIARFMPIIRTFAPFVAGVGSMKYPRFITFCLIGNVIWVNLFCWAGYLLGNNAFVQKNFSIIIIAIILVSVLPPIVTIISHKLKKKQSEESNLL